MEGTPFLKVSQKKNNSWLPLSGSAQTALLPVQKLKLRVAPKGPTLVTLIDTVLCCD